MTQTCADWFEPESSILEWKTPMPAGNAKCNVTYNCVDRHAKGPRKDKVAYIFVLEPTDRPTQKITYGELYKEVNKFANVLKYQGVKKKEIGSLSTYP
jgi:acetyl-CoA synthetase